MLAKRLDALPCGPKKPLQGRIRRAPASPLPRARVNRWTASENIRRYDWTASSGSVVANDPINSIDPTGWAEIETKYYETGSRIARTASVTVDADFDNDGADDLSQGQLNQLGKDFSGFIRANDGADISNAGKLISGDGSIGDKTFTRVVSQFVGASGLAQGWDKVDRIDVSARNYWKFGADAGYRAFKDDPSRGVIFITGSPADWAGNYLYDSPSNMARALFHEVGHTPRGVEYNHSYVDIVARRNLMRSGLGGGGCWSYGVPGAGFPGC